MIKTLRFLILAFWYVVLVSMLLSPKPIRAARIYSGTDHAKMGQPALPVGVQKVGLLIRVKVSSWTADTYPFCEDNVNNTINGTICIAANSSFFNSLCGQTNQFFITWFLTSPSPNNEVRWISPPSTGVMHTLFVVWSLPGYSGSASDMNMWIDAVRPGMSGGGTCPNGNFHGNGFAPAGTTMNLMNSSTHFQGGTIDEVAWYASTDSSAGFNGVGLPRTVCTSEGCTETGDLVTLGTYPAVSNCLSSQVQPIAYWPQLESDAASGTDPDWGVAVDAVPRLMTLTGTTGSPTGLTRCPNSNRFP